MASRGFNDISENDFSKHSDENLESDNSEFIYTHIQQHCVSLLTVQLSLVWCQHTACTMHL